ncbi:glycoside hydrolase family 9 protein [Vibrio mediterranei]|uniref:Chitobiase n=2 Tax=Vibrio TaxID=662 RepID=A0AAC9THT6_9VIBR|nr:glycoside hydrolase family 9 protein [Vibrio mediterranei]ASI89864.1 chitobiase [Vibrio mediterranei]
MQLLTNHIGYQVNNAKRAVLMCTDPHHPVTTAYLVDAYSENTVLELTLEGGQSVDNWHCGVFFTIDFSQYQQAGRYYLRYQSVRSHDFVIEEHNLLTRSFSDVIHYFKSQRCGGQFDEHDKQARIIGSDETADVHGGWYDASGDVSKYLSHLSYANYLNPQQTPMVVWNMLKADDLLLAQQDAPHFVRARLQEEALYGAEFLARMQHSDGYFYMTVFDKWSKDVEQRDICAYETQLGHKKQDYQAGFRQGAGIAIAALAKASQSESATSSQATHFIEIARKGYWHLQEHNTQYLNDGITNIIDEYCALLATVELYKASGEDLYLDQARIWADSLALRAKADDNYDFFWSSDSDGSRPFYHAAEAGLPVIALAEYLAIETNLERQQRFAQLVTQACQFELTVTAELFNPFSYPRQYVKGVDEPKRSAFFIPHNNESGYWWQGENARIASLASMALIAKDVVSDSSLRQQLESYATHCLDWILGLNPYDMCMLDGYGFNNPDYLPQLGFFNAHGGICNGITGGFDDERDIAFNPRNQKDDMLQNWRWGEQWIPHAAWYLLAVALKHSDSKGEHHG